MDGRIVVDLVDPHNHSLADAPGKWSSLARFARENPDAFRRVTAVIRNKEGALQGLDLAGGEDIAAVFKEFGGNY